MEKWILASKKADFTEIAKKYNISPVLARIMVNRDVREDEDIKKYLNGTVNDFYSPFLLKDIEKAVDIITESIDNNEKISIASDFDDDGIFASMVLYTAFTRLGVTAVIDTPDRCLEGYGLNERIVDDAHKRGISLIVTCDNGIAAKEAIAYAKSLGMKVVVTDHHEVPYEISDNMGDDDQNFTNKKYIYPEADAIVNPKQADCPYPFKKLCGAGVAYKVVEVLYERFGIDKSELYALLEYVAIATVADVMDLVDENRIIVKYGLDLLRHTKNLGLRALIEVCQIDIERLSSYHIGFVIGPCFNAAGRLETVKLALDLLMAETKEEAAKLALELKTLNDSRKEMTCKGLEQAIEKIENSNIKNDKIIIVKLQECHESLAGIIAGRIRERYHKPVYVFVDVAEGVKGSGRSIEAYNMFAGLIECKDLLGRFGGHHMAAGLSLPLENFEELKRRLNENAKLTDKDFIPVVQIDVPMPIGYITEQFVNQLELLEPFGKGNTKPLFAEQHFWILRANIIGKNKNVIKMRLMNRDRSIIDGIYFGDVEKFIAYVKEIYGESEVERMFRGSSNNVDLAFTYYPGINEYMGNRTLQIVIQNYCKIE